MTEGHNYHIEIAGRLATLYVVRDMTKSLPELIDACDALPAAVDVLSLNLDKLDQLGDRGMAAIDEVRRHWQATRQGTLRVAFALPKPNRRVSYTVNLELGAETGGL